MEKRLYKPEGIPQLFPYLVVKDAEKSLNFYKEAFGFSLSSPPKLNEEGKVDHAEMKFGADVVIMFAPEEACAKMGMPRQSPASSNTPPSLTLYVYCENVDALYKQAIASGAKDVAAPYDSFWGDRCCTLIDINGYEWMFATNVADHSVS